MTKLLKMHSAFNLNVLTLISLFLCYTFLIQNYRKLDKYLILTKETGGRWDKVFKGQLYTI